MAPNERDNNYQLNYTVLSRLYHHAMLGYDKKFRPNFMGMGYCFEYKNCYDFFLFGGNQYFHVPPVQSKNSNNK